MRKTGNRFRKMDEKPLFSGTINGLVRYRGFIWRPARPRSWKSYWLMVRQKSVVFSPLYCIQTLQSMYFYTCQLACYSKEWCCWGTHCLSQEALDGGTLAAQAAHNCCRRYPFLLPGHKSHFLSHWNFSKTSRSIFTKHLAKNCNKKKKGGRHHGRLGRATWTDWLKKEPSMQVRSLLEF